MKGMNSVKIENIASNLGMACWRIFKFTQTEREQTWRLNSLVATFHCPSVPIEMPTVSLMWKSGWFFRDFTVSRRLWDNLKELADMYVCLLQMAVSRYKVDSRLLFSLRSGIACMLMFWFNSWVAVWRFDSWETTSWASTTGSHLSDGDCSHPWNWIIFATVLSLRRNLCKSCYRLLWVLFPICQPISQSNVEVIIILLLLSIVLINNIPAVQARISRLS